MAQVEVLKGALTITTSGNLDAANGIDMRRADCLWFTLDSGETTATFTWYVSHDGVNYLPAKDEDNAAITQTVEDDVPQPMPAKLNGAPYVLAIGDVAAAGVYSTKKMHG